MLLIWCFEIDVLGQVDEDWFLPIVVFKNLFAIDKDGHAVITGCVQARRGDTWCLEFLAEEDAFLGLAILLQPDPLWIGLLRFRRCHRGKGR